MNTLLGTRSPWRIVKLTIAGLSILTLLSPAAVEGQVVQRIPRAIVFPALGKPSNIPFGIAGNEIGFEQIYDGSLFPEVASIREINFATAAGFGGPRPRYQEPADRLLEQRDRDRRISGATGLGDRTPTGRNRLPALSGPSRTCVHLRVALATTGQQPEAIDKTAARTKSLNYRVVVDEPRFDYQARGDGSFDLAFPVRLDPPFVFRPERDGNLLLEITIGTEIGTVPIYLEAGKSPLIGSAYRPASSSVAITRPGQGLHTRFLVDELIFEKKKEPDESK